jgi:two-component system, OmpR family, KDP operon response regulator KdpE
MHTPPQILLVDDDPQVVRYLRRALERGGYQVSTTTSGKEALALIQQTLPDLLILDLNMPEIDGFDVLKAEREKFPYMRILVISGYLHGALLEAAKVFGAVATLEKPVSADTLLTKVREILG